MKNNILKGIGEYYNDINNNDNSRYKSWEHCYATFYNAIKNRDKSKKTIDYLCLQLAFYLASWGMYRGSSFLLQKDYTIHKEPVEIILNDAYSKFLGMKCDILKDDINLLFELVNKLKEKYCEIRNNVKGYIDSDITDTLITKVLLGTLGCVPAYDRFFKDGLRKIDMKNLSFNEKSIMDLCQYYAKYNDELEKIRKTMHIEKIEYTQMKLIDMGFWMLGRDNSNRNRLI